MMVNFNFLAAALGCLALLAWWIVKRRSGRRGLALVGCGVIIGATLAYTYPARLASLAGLAFAVCFVSLMLYCLGKVSYARRQRGPRDQAPDQMYGRCSKCATVAPLHHSKRGWLCARCARRYGVAA